MHSGFAIGGRQEDYTIYNHVNSGADLRASAHRIGCNRPLQHVQRSGSGQRVQKAFDRQTANDTLIVYDILWEFLL